MTRTQQWAKTAYDCITEVEKLSDEKKKKEYRSFALSFPAMLHSWGLCQAVAFAEAKKETFYLGHLKTILDKNNLEKNAREASMSDYQMLTRDTMKAAKWLKRYTEARILKESGEKIGKGM